MNPALPILHHYDFSPFAEKIRLCLGLKGLAWHSVIAPSVMPKPELVALTGGYRHIPVLQFGADVFCDTRCIARELERRHPTPPLVEPAVAGLSAAIEAWAERDLFWPAARFVSGINADHVDPQLHVDRATMRGKHPPSHARLKAVAHRELTQLRPQIRIVDALLADGRSFLLSDSPGQADFAVYHGLWFLSAMPVDCTHELAGFPRILAWMGRVAAVGYGQSQAMTASEALEIAAQSTPAPPRPGEADDAYPALGTAVEITPDGYANAPIAGTLCHVDAWDLAIHRRDAQLGEVVVHFPRTGYSVRTAKPGAES